eukprot:TRINITY_DN5165_c0_g1_i4.p1 TRINITY_DN5165_c0_g1~~TRINITY_DN5165_c0_g1_i4.p1  ORF type:complete len:426 (+),score=72.58 TRINITY_DN5165_c0_g1_i4:404-1681(+)
MSPISFSILNAKLICLITANNKATVSVLYWANTGTVKKKKKMNKRKLLDEDVEHADVTKKPKKDELSIPETTVAVEIHRAARVKNLRTALVRECKKQGVKPPLLCFERWHARSLLQDKGDPLLPCGAEDGALLKDLLRGGIRDPVAIAKPMRKMTEKCRAALKNAPEAPESDNAVTKEQLWDKINLHPASKKAYQSINNTHYEKLWKLHKGSEESFDSDVFKVVLRYDSLGGHGYQAGLTGEAFDVLHKSMNVTCEAFASPLNCRYRKYCSAFPDTDAVFGSLGNFFDISPQEGSYEANPPFVPETMTACAEHIDMLLSSATGALSFVVIVPVWKEVQAWTQLTTSPHLVSSFTISARQHSFTDGAQYIRPALHRPSSYDSGVFVLQNNKGKEAYPVPETLEADLKNAMGGDCMRPITRENVVYV